MRKYRSNSRKPAKALTLLTVAAVSLVLATVTSESRTAVGYAYE